MRKIIAILILILVVIFVTLSALGRGGEYSAERIFYSAMKAYEKIQVNPEVAPPGLVYSVEVKLKRVVNDYPHTNTAKAARMALAEFYATTKRYNKAIATLDDIIKAKGQGARLLSRAHLFKGTIYEQQDDWNMALREYEILRDEYTETAAGLQAPLYIGRYYREKGLQDRAKEAYSEAVAFYTKLEEENKGELFGYTAANLLRESYLNLGEFDKVGEILEYTVKNYPVQLVLKQQLPYIEMIFVRKLQRPDKAVELYEHIKQRVDNEEISNLIDKVIARILAQKEG